MFLQLAHSRTIAATTGTTMITRSRLFSCRRIAPVIFRVLTIVTAIVAAVGFAGAQQQPPSFTDQRSLAARPLHPSDLAFRRSEYFREPRAYPFHRGTRLAPIKPRCRTTIRNGAPRSGYRCLAWPRRPRPSPPPRGHRSGRLQSQLRRRPPEVSIRSPFIHSTRTSSISAAPRQVWKTVDGGQSWVPLTDRQCSLAMGAIAIDPINPNIVYAGTGEENFEHDAYYGCGVLRSADGGATWTRLGASIFVSPSGGGATISRIAVDPTTAGSLTTTKIYVASSLGVYRSTDSGATWNGLAISCNASSATDLVVDSTTPANVYAAFGNKTGTPPNGDFLCNGVYKSTNGGDSWSRLASWGGYQSRPHQPLHLAFRARDTLCERVMGHNLPRPQTRHAARHNENHQFRRNMDAACGERRRLQRPVLV